jgi:hypothetical protein
MRVNLAKIFYSCSIPAYYSFEIFHNEFVFRHEESEIVISSYPNGNLESIAFKTNNNWHRPSSDGPAYQSWYPSGQKNVVSYDECGRLHRPYQQGPAWQCWREDGSISDIQYKTYGKKNALLSKPVFYFRII